MPYRLATPQQSYFSVSYFPNAVKHFYAFGKILIVFSAKSAIVSVIQNAPVAQLDRVSASEAEGRGFESRRAHQFKKKSSKEDFFYWGVGARRRTRDVGSVSESERRRQAVPSGTKSAAMSNPAGRTNFEKNPRKGIFLLGRRGAEKNTRPWVR